MHDKFQNWFFFIHSPVRQTSTSSVHCAQNVQNKHTKTYSKLVGFVCDLRYGYANGNSHHTIIKWFSLHFNIFNCKNSLFYKKTQRAIATNIILFHCIGLFFFFFIWLIDSFSLRMKFQLWGLAVQNVQQYTDIQ